MDNILEVKSLSKSFKLFHNNKDRLLNIIPFINKKFDRHTSLENISFDVKKGEFVSIIGKNGSGKSTLLKILCGVLKKTSGEYSVHGSIVSLLELGTGFNSELSGRENIITSAKTMNFDIAYIYSKMDEIEAFADLEEYFDMPIKTYSSGMYVRLAMSLFLHLNPELFIIDEALSVGDIFFQQKCFAKIEQMRKNGVAFLFVSHDINTVLTMSDRVLLLDHSKQIYFGDKHEACRLYYHEQSYSIQTVKTNADILVEKSLDFYNLKEQIVNNSFFNPKNIKKISNKGQIFGFSILNNGNYSNTVNLMHSLDFYLLIEIVDANITPAFSFIVKDKYNNKISSINYNIVHGIQIVHLSVDFTIEPAEYSIDLKLGEKYTETKGHNIIEYQSVATINVTFDYENKIPFHGKTYLNNKVKIIGDIE